MLRFFRELNIQLLSQLAKPVAELDLVNKKLVDSNVLFIQKHEDFKDQARFDLYEQLQYMDLMKYQHMAHTAVQTNDFDLRVDT